MITDDEMQVIGENARRLRRKAKLTQRALVARVRSSGESISVSEISALENGHPVSIGVIRKVKAALQTTLHQLSKPS